MNLIEAWNKAKEGQLLWRDSWLNPHDAYETWQKRGEFNEWIKLHFYSSDSLLADDWEIVKEKKEATWSDVMWHRDKSGLIYPTGICSGISFEQLEKKPKMKMTLEWEE